MKLP
jgi:hypothetical protein